MDIAPLLVWIGGMSTLLGFGTTIYNLLTSGARKNDKRIGDMTCRLDDLDRDTSENFAAVDRRLQRVEDRLTTVPSTEMMHRIELSLASMNGELGKIDERLKPVTAITERMQELLLHQARGGS